MDEEVCALDLQTELGYNAKNVVPVGAEDLVALMKHYNITIEDLKSILKTIHEWYEKQPHLPQVPLHDRFILGFLMIRGFSVEKTKKSIDSFYTIRQRIPELACGRDPNDKTWLWYMQRFWYILPKKTIENNRITIFRLDKEEDFEVLSIIKLGFLISEYRIWNDIAKADCWILDFKHVSLQQALQMTPALISKIIYTWRSCFGVRLVSVHIVNMPSHAETMFNIFKKGLSPKIVKRIHFVKTEDLQELFPNDIMPKEYGGNEKSFKSIKDDFMDDILSEPWRKYLLEQDTVASDESKRLIPSKADELFGVHGSFRQLSVD